MLLRNSVTGEWHYYPMNGRRILDASGRVPGLNSNLASTVGGIGDFDGDGRADVLTRGGRWFLSPMNGRTVLGGGSGYVDGLAPDVSSALAGIGDMNGDGRDDVLVRRTDGAWYYYPMNGLQVLASAGDVALPAAAAWRVPGLVVDDGGGGGDDSDRHGNTRSSATRVALPSTTTGRIDPGNDTDYFRFELSARRAVVLESTGGLDTIGTLFNARGSRIAQNNDGAGRPNFRIERTLGAGTYYVRVHSRGTATGTYTLHLRTGGGSGGRLAISTAADSAVQPFETFSLRVENGTAGADYDILIDLSGTGNFLDRNTIEVAPVTSADGDLLMAAPPPEALAEGNTTRRFALLVRERGEGTLSNTLRFTLGRTDVPAALAGHPTVILDVVLKAVYEGLDDPLLAVEAGAIEPGRSVRTARALGLDTAYSDAQAEALLRSLFGVELVAPVALSGRSQAASWQPSARVRCQFWAPNALCNAMEQLTDCVGDAMNGRLSGSPFRHCARLVREELAGGWTDYGEKINSFGNTLRGVAPRVARVLGLGRRPAQAVYDINAAVRQGIGMNKTLRTITERAEALHQGFESLRDGTRTLTEGLPDLVAEVEQQAGADGVEGDEREAVFALVEEADHHYGDAAAYDSEGIENVYTGEANVETLGTVADGGSATCAEGYEEFPVTDSTSTCVRSSLVEPNCYSGSREVSHPDLGGASACLYYSLDYLQPNGSCRENYAKVTFNGRETCRWAELETDRSAWYTLEKEHGIESPQTHPSQPPNYRYHGAYALGNPVFQCGNNGCSLIAGTATSGDTQAEADRRALEACAERPVFGAGRTLACSVRARFGDGQCRVHAHNYVRTKPYGERDAYVGIHFWEIVPREQARAKTVELDARCAARYQQLHYEGSDGFCWDSYFCNPQ